MKTNRESKAGSRERACGPRRRRRAFTLIEIMIVVGIMAIIMTIAIPSVYQRLHKDSMRQALVDVTEACRDARAHAIMNGVATELRIRPADRSISVIEGAAPPPAGADGSIYSFEGENLVEHRPGGASIFSAKLSDRILIEFIGVNLVGELEKLEEVSCTFYPNGTSDELVILLRSDQGEIRKITTDVITGIADVEVVK